MGCLNNEYSLLWVTRAEESKAKKKEKNPGAVLRVQEQTALVRRVEEEFWK